MEQKRLSITGLEVELTDQIETESRASAGSSQIGLSILTIRQDLINQKSVPHSRHTQSGPIILSFFFGVVTIYLPHCKPRDAPEHEIISVADS